MTAAKNVVLRHRGVERGVKALDNAWRRADLRHLTRGASARLVNLYSSYVCVRFCFVLPFVTAVSVCFFLRYVIVGGMSGMGPAPVLYLLGS